MYVYVFNPFVTQVVLQINTRNIVLQNVIQLVTQSLNTRIPFEYYTIAGPGDLR
jgi:hypothetical protein